MPYSTISQRGVEEKEFSPRDNVEDLPHLVLVFGDNQAFHQY